MDAEVSQETFDGVVLQVAVAAVHLEGVVDDEPALVGGKLLGHCAVHGTVGLLGGQQLCTVSDHKTRGF